jgi:hypothetical protein
LGLESGNLGFEVGDERVGLGWLGWLDLAGFLGSGQLVLQNAGLCSQFFSVRVQIESLFVFGLLSGSQLGLYLANLLL